MNNIIQYTGIQTGGKRQKVMVFGGSGLLGRQLVINLPNAGYDVLAPKHSEIDISDFQHVLEYVTFHMPDVVINCAAYTNVDLCEVNKGMSLAVNRDGAQNIAVSAHENDIRLIHVSTDYVFSSDRKEKWFSEDDETCPCNQYGMSKALGEHLVMAECPNASIVRTAWLYGPGGPSFVHSIVRKMYESKDYGEVKVVDDQFGCPTPTMLVVDTIIHPLKHPEARGIFHAVSRGWTSRFKFASEVERIIKVYHRDLPLLGTIRSCSSSDFHMDAKRPTSSILTSDNLEKIGYRRFGWESALRMFLLREWDNRDIIPNGPMEPGLKEIIDTGKKMSWDNGPVIDVDVDIGHSDLVSLKQ